MDIQQSIDNEKRKIATAKTTLEREIEALRKEIEQVEHDAIGTMNKVKMLVAAQVGRGVGMEAIMGETYARAKRGEFKNARDYIDHLRKSIDEAYDAISKLKEIEANLDAIIRDSASLQDRARIWIDKTEQLIR